MLLSCKTTVKISAAEANIIGHMCYAAYKLWNVCNYERNHHKELGLKGYPDWYYQKKEHKDTHWYKQLPSQTAQEVCKLLDKAWKSFFVLKKTGGIENPNPPRYRKENMVITYMQNAVVHEKEAGRVRLSLPKRLRSHMTENYQINDRYLYLENKIFRDIDRIKQIKVYPPEKGECGIIVIYEKTDVEKLPDNGRYLSIDLGLHNLLTCYDKENEKAFILGRKYLSICHYYHKRISRKQSRWYGQQIKKGIKHPKTSKHIQRLYKKKEHVTKDYLHKMTKYIVSYCVKNKINRVIIGDIRNIRKENNLGKVTNQKLHSLPYEKIYVMLNYKLAQEGILLVKQEESYTSQCSPHSEKVSVEYARKNNRYKRGLYKDDRGVYNADAVGAFNILRKYLQKNGKTEKKMSVTGLESPKVIKVAV